MTALAVDIVESRRSDRPKVRLRIVFADVDKFAEAMRAGDPFADEREAS